MWSDSPGWNGLMDEADVGGWMEFCGDGRMEYSNTVRWMEKRKRMWVDGWMVDGWNFVGMTDGWSGVGYLANNKDRLTQKPGMLLKYKMWHGI